MQDIEKLGLFYLGRHLDVPSAGGPPAAPVEPIPLLLDARDLTTHAVVLGMTGSGKTGLCVDLLEEAAIDGVPALVIDPKGDLGNLLLAFPELRPEDFRPYVDEEEARRLGIAPDELAARTAAQWAQGLKDWGQDGARIARMRQAADFTIYTPAGSAGRPLSILRSFSAPGRSLLDDSEALRDRVLGAVSGLLALLGLDADPLRSREHALLSTLFLQAWEQAQDLDLGALVRLIQAPPFSKVGVMDLETFYPSRERMDLALRVNNLLASPGFAAWTEGEALDVGGLLYTPEGRPRISILSIAHLDDAERMFFVTLLLEEVLAWMRTQPGTSSLRALLYMDEVFGYFPPTANPPSKTPMLTLLKQARAFGLGVVLATQNPVDLDYKGLSNAGTWFLGRLQTERDQARVLDGLQASASIERGRLGSILASLQKRQFIHYSVKGREPAPFQTRWTLCYLRGPLTRDQIKSLTRSVSDSGTAGGGAGPVALPETRPISPAGTQPAGGASAIASGAEPAAPVTAAHSAAARPPSMLSSSRPVLPPDVPELFLPAPQGSPGPEPSNLSPFLLGQAQVHFASTKAGIDRWERVLLLAPLRGEIPLDPWEDAFAPESSPAGQASLEDPTRSEFHKDPPENARFGELPPPAARAKSYADWTKALRDHLYRSRTLRIWRCPSLKEVSRPGESENEFRLRMALKAREARDEAVDRMQKKFDSKVATVEERIRRAEERVTKEQAQRDQQKLQTAISFGSTLLGALIGGRRRGLGRATTAVRGVGRIAREREDVALAQARVEELRGQLAELEQQMAAEADQIREASAEPAITPEPVRPRKSEITVERVALLWKPEGPPQG